MPIFKKIDRVKSWDFSKAADEIIRGVLGTLADIAVGTCPG